MRGLRWCRQRLRGWVQEQARQLRELPWRELDLKESGSWPTSLQALIALAVFTLALLAVQWLLASSPREQDARLVAQETQALSRFETLSYQAVNLPMMRQQMGQLKVRMQRVLEQLPSDAEVPALLDAISDAAREQQLSIDSIKLEPAVAREFVFEQPFDIQVRGGYHQIAAFLAEVAAMPRIVTLHDFTLAPVAGSPTLRLTMLAKTYRYRETDDAAGAGAGS
ncbi:MULTISPECIES: type 4a pilus biogenesis protein PilO [unclassified Salinicola]|uniref:type 4a pilus biogenesis protein PilO n=1 Tax=unclassified Salinicola TaxID=2634022 RepID=UPI001A8E4055|nr:MULTISPECIES: type 4a pilus biogenesis protein PilO [unclassified Salinicola]MCE3026777.1 type 4a pilus biogenesis protein PilO [Salinicola sp. DM10]WIX31944.1 type 4a pilus biogenesis protein PilO [Salinicola sp. JS01]